MVGIPPRTLQQVVAEIAGQQGFTAPDQPGGVLDDLWICGGGGPTSGATYAGQPNPAIGATWFAVGSGITAFSPGLTSLVAEVGRAPIYTTVSVTATTGRLFALLASNVGNQWIWEYGVFGGAATLAPNSGTLLSYGTFALPRLKTTSKRIVLQWND